MKRRIKKYIRMLSKKTVLLFKNLTPHYRRIIYAALIIIGASLIFLSFVLPQDWANASCGVGTGIFTSTLVTIFINWENEDREKRRIQQDKRFLMKNMLEYCLDVYEDVVYRINEYITLSELECPNQYKFYRDFTRFNEFAQYLDSIDLNSLTLKENKRLCTLLNLRSYRLDQLIAELRHLPKQEFFLRGLLSEKEYTTLINQHANDQYLAYAERIHEFWNDEILDLQRCIRFLRMTLYITARTISVFDFAVTEAEVREKDIKERIDQLYFDEIFTQSDAYIEEQINRGQAEMEYYAEHPEILEELEHQYNECEIATEEDRYLEDLANCIIAFSEYSIDDILAKLDKNSPKVRAFFLQDSIRQALLKKRKLRKVVAVKYGKNYLKDLGR